MRKGFDHFLNVPGTRGLEVLQEIRTVSLLPLDNFIDSGRAGICYFETKDSVKFRTAACQTSRLLPN